MDVNNITDQIVHACMWTWAVAWEGCPTDSLLVHYMNASTFSCFHRFVHSHRSNQSSISLSGCAAPRLRWGRWGRPCPPLYWSAGGSSAAPPPWTEWSAAGCLLARPPPHRHALPEYWPTGRRRRERFSKDSTGDDGREGVCSTWKSISMDLLETVKTPQWISGVVSSFDAPARKRFLNRNCF